MSSKLHNNVTYNTYDLETFYSAEFLRNCSAGRTLITRKEKFIVKDASLITVVSEIVDFLKTLKVETNSFGLSNNSLIISDQERIWMLISRSFTDSVLDDEDDDHNETRRGRNDTSFMIIAPYGVVKAILKYLEGRFDKPQSRVDWWYDAKDGASRISVNLAETKPIYDEFYPFIKNGAFEYFRDYLSSNAPVLLMSGPPGTGKTSYLRYMLNEFKLKCYIAYDMKLFQNDAMFIELITGSTDMLIMEDAENLVLPRKKAENNIMSRFLNISDGLIKFPEKKFIFTTNETDFSNTDEALLRPGRCYGSLEFRSLTFDESLKACGVAGLTPPAEERNYTLAELFNQNADIQKARKVGFV